MLLPKTLSRAAANTKNYVMKNPGKTAGVVVAPLVAAAAVPLALGAIGFGSGGVAGASFAAGTHAGIGNVATPSVFAFLQSAGAGGAALPIVQGVTGAVTAVGSVGTAYTLQKRKATKEDEEKKRTEEKDMNDGEIKGKDTMDKYTMYKEAIGKETIGKDIGDKKNKLKSKL